MDNYVMYSPPHLPTTLPPLSLNRRAQTSQTPANGLGTYAHALCAQTLAKFGRNLVPRSSSRATLANAAIKASRRIV